MVPQKDSALHTLWRDTMHLKAIDVAENPVAHESSVAAAYRAFPVFIDERVDLLGVVRGPSSRLPREHLPRDHVMVEGKDEVHVEGQQGSGSLPALRVWHIVPMGVH